MRFVQIKSINQKWHESSFQLLLISHSSTEHEQKFMQRTVQLNLLGKLTNLEVKVN